MREIIFFYGADCPHCKRMRPIVAKLKDELKCNITSLEVWNNEENADKMPSVTVAEKVTTPKPAGFGDYDTPVVAEDVPFSSESSLTNEDKLAVITKLAKDKLGATGVASVKEKVMEATEIAFIPVQYDAIIKKLTER